MKLFKQISLFLVFFAISLSAQTFVASGDTRNQASFESDAPLEDIVGISNNLEAVVMLDKNDITKSPKGKVTVDLNSLQTGIALRDEHLRSPNWLNTGKYPNAEFKLTGITNTSGKNLEDGKRITATLHGKFSVHGVTKDVTVPAELTYFKESARTKSKMKGNLLKVKAEFNIKLSDYGVKIPDMVVGKLNDVVKIAATFIATDAKEHSMDNPCGMKTDMGKCNPCGMKKMHESGKCNPCGMGKMHKSGKCNPCGGLK